VSVRIRILPALVAAMCLAINGVIQACSTTQPIVTNKIIVIMEENHSSPALNSMPFLENLADTYGEATHWSAFGHPSLPNYLAIFGGSTFGLLGSDCSPSSSCQATSPSVFGQSIAARKTAGGFEQSMPTACDPYNSGEYAVRHNPWAYFFREHAWCNAGESADGDTALKAAITNGLPNVSIVTPNLLNDAHDGTLKQADDYLKKWVPLIMAGPDYQAGHLAIVVVFDEGSSNNQVPFVLVSPKTSHVVDSSQLNDYALTRLIDNILEVAPLRNAANAPDIRSVFGIATG
jgi:hypothetical protein